MWPNFGHDSCLSRLSRHHFVLFVAQRCTCFNAPAIYCTLPFQFSTWKQRKMPSWQCKRSLFQSGSGRIFANASLIFIRVLYVFQTDFDLKTWFLFFLLCTDSLNVLTRLQQLKLHTRSWYNWLILNMSEDYALKNLSKKHTLSCFFHHYLDKT